MTTALKIANMFFACHCDYAHACYSLMQKAKRLIFLLLSEVDCWALTKPRHRDSNYNPMIPLQFTGGYNKCTTSASNDVYYKQHCVKGAVITLTTVAPCS